MTTESFLSLFSTKLNYDNLTLARSIFICFCMASFYVISLYLWSHQNRFNRNEPSVIKRRFISVILSCFICFISVYLIADKQGGHLITEWIGFKFGLSGLKACLASIVATVILFSGPLLQQFISDYLLSYSFQVYETNGTRNEREHDTFVAKQIKSLRLRYQRYVLYMKFHLADMCFWRNYIISPFTEEFVFRSCMIPLLVQNLSFTSTVFIAPLFFGLAHLHHIIEGYFTNELPLAHLIGVHMFQFSYTYIFGVYSSFLFMRTGSLFSCFLSHSFCNFMGFPNFRQLMSDFDTKVKYSVAAVYIIGLVMFTALVGSLTEPSLFHNKVFY